VSSQQSGAATPLSLLANPSGAWIFADGQYISANTTTRGEIMAFILTNPGVYLREISEDMGLAMGVVQYHTWVLTKDGEVEERRSGRYRRFFGAGRYQEGDRIVISLLRQGTTGKILVALSGNELLTHMRLASILHISSQALSWQMRRLKDGGIVETFEIQGRGERGYRLVDKVAPIIRSQIHQRTRAEPNPIPVAAVIGKE